MQEHARPSLYAEQRITQRQVDSRCSFLFFEFLKLKVSLSVFGRTPESRRSIYVQHRCSQKLRGPEAQATYRR